MDSEALGNLSQTFAAANPSQSASATVDLLGYDHASQILLEAKNLDVLVVELPQALVAVAVLAWIPSLVHSGRPTLLIDLLVVDSDYRKRGIGTALLQHSIDLAYARDAYKIMVVTRHDNEAAQRLYQKFRFKINSVGLALYIN